MFICGPVVHLQSTSSLQSVSTITSLNSLPCSPISLCLPLIRTLVSTLRGNPGDSPPLEILHLITHAGPLCLAGTPCRFCGHRGAMLLLITTFLREDRRVRAACSAGEQHLENRGEETSPSCGAGLIPRPRTSPVSLLSDTRWFPGSLRRARS